MRDDPFRAQLTLPEQRELYDYWNGLADADGRVLRERFRPSAIPLLLPNVSLLQLEPDTGLFRYRLAGTKLRDIFDGEVTALELSEAFSGSTEQYWRRTFSRVFETGKPCQGVVRGPQRDKENLVQFWLRLPLWLSKPEPEVVLGLDMCFSAGQESVTSEVRAAIEATDVVLG